MPDKKKDVGKRKKEYDDTIEPIYIGDTFEEAICRLVRVDKKEAKRKEKKKEIEAKAKKKN